MMVSYFDFELNQRTNGSTREGIDMTAKDSQSSCNQAKTQELFKRAYHHQSKVSYRVGREFTIVLLEGDDSTLTGLAGKSNLGLREGKQNSRYLSIFSSKEKQQQLGITSAASSLGR